MDENTNAAPQDVEVEEATVEEETVADVNNTENDIVVDTLKTYKAKYSVSFPDGTVEMQEKQLEGKNEFDIQRALCKENFNRADERKVIKVISINEMDRNGKELIKEGPSANVI